MVTFAEERLAYYNEYGRALAAWTQLEHVMYTVASLFYPEGMPRNMLGMGFTGIQGFSSKLHFADRSVTRGMAGGDKVIKDRWASIVDELGTLSSKRNHLAHWPTDTYESNTEGRRIALRPWDVPKSSPKDQPPPRAYCVKDLIRTRREFLRAINHLANFVLHLAQQPELPEEFAKPEDDLPTIQEIVDQMNAELGHPRQSAKARKREQDAVNAAASLENANVKQHHRPDTKGG
jgi:hypothetical protein